MVTATGLALFRLGSRTREAESRLGGQTRGIRGWGGTLALLGAAHHSLQFSEYS